MVTEPLATLGLLLIPGAVILGPRLGAFIWGGFVVVTLAALIALAISLLARARRYARAPVQYAVLRAGDHIPPFWAYWRPTVLYTEDGDARRFGKRLAPYPRLQRGKPYMVYFLQEHQTNILLSIAPTDHPDAESWKPSAHFQSRLSHHR